MITLDEAIAHEREMSEPCSIRCEDNCDCTECRKYHKQLAEWLEELKAYREIGTVEECRNSVLDIERAYNKGYADGSLSVTEEIRGKAIDDFVNACKEDILCQTFGLHQNGVEKIAEQLKAGGEYGNK